VDRSILFPGGGITLRETADLARRFDEAGFDSLYCVEAYRSGFVPLTVLASATERCRIGTYILNAHAHPPIAAAMASRDVDDLSGGRVVLGVGSGNPHINQHHLGASNERPLTVMRDYVTGLRQAVSSTVGQAVSFEFQGSPIDWSPAIPAVRDRIPVYLAAMYPKMRALAGTVADGIALGSLHSPDYIRDVVRPAVTGALESAGRDPADFRFVASALTSVDDSSEVARRRARQGLCRLFTPLPHPYYEYILREQGWSTLVDAVSAAMQDQGMERAVELVSDDAVDALLIAGDVKGCNAAIDRYVGVIDEIILTDATSVGASIDPATSGARAGLEALLDLAP
jgi:alkanesulfonate monooxygenase SsuD/methylene tetrahydromethanopterin reductase-like flavin-dependent oxidoreductase (luciferase family)